MGDRSDLPALCYGWSPGDGFDCNEEKINFLFGLFPDNREVPVKGEWL
jgi:hypothetical protein